MLGEFVWKLAGDKHDARVTAYVHKYQRSRREPEFEKTEAGRAILKLSPAEQVKVLCAAFKANVDAVHRMYATFLSAAARKDHHAITTLSVALLKRRLPLKCADLRQLIKTSLDDRAAWPDDWPVDALVRTIENYADNHDISDPLNKALNDFVGFVTTSSRAETRNLATRITAIIASQNADASIVLVGTELGRRVTDFVNNLDGSVQQLWTPIFQHAAEIQNKTKPTAKWLGAANGPVSALGAEAFTSAFDVWFRPCSPETVYRDTNTDLFKALIWTATQVDDDRLPPVLSRLAETCYKKIPGVGPPNIKIGNACIYVLGEMAVERAAAELVRLRSRIKFNQGRKQIGTALAAAAERAGLSIEDLEEITLPDFGLGPDGVLRETLGDVTAEIRIAGSDEVVFGWLGADGKPRKTVPASVKRDHAEDLKALRARVKEIKGLLSGLRFRIESLYLQQRVWPFSVWRERYLDHPLMANLTRRLIWTVAGTAVIAAGDDLLGVDGKPVKAPGEKAEVALWHPIDADAGTVLAWRQRLAALEVTQPFKQAYREIYVLTDAERATGIYSNRFAGHILRQHLLNALCQTRAWRFGQYLAYDMTGATPARALPGFGLQAEFRVDPVDYDQHTEMGAYLYMATDQVRFVNDTDVPVSLMEVPPVVLSEVMRDVDLFVGVASVGANPEWQDGGPEGRHREYWWGYSFGDIGERGKTRHAALAELLPKLKIADHCELTEKFLTVRGTRRTYKIHLGSGNIMMEPNDQYLCIVQSVRGLGKGGDRIRLPFEGDGLLSIILSKAFLLVEDDKITDKTILSQIGG